MFHLRSGGQGASSPTQPPTIEAIRRRARHRLIGASVLVLAGVIGLPLLFDTQPRPIAVDIPIYIPAKPTAPVATLPATPVAPASDVKVDGLDEREQAVASSPPAPPRQEPAPVPVPAPAPVAAPAKAPVAPPKPPAEAPKPAAPAAPSADGGRAQALLDGKSSEAAALRLVVQVGAFAEQARAQEVRTRLERAGLKTYTHVAETPEGKRIRVRLGPFASRADAEQAAAKVKALGLPAAILTL